MLVASFVTIPHYLGRNALHIEIPVENAGAFLCFMFILLSEKLFEYEHAIVMN